MKKQKEIGTKKELSNIVYNLLKKNHPLEITADLVAFKYGIKKPSIFYHFDSVNNLLISGFKVAAEKGDVKLLRQIYTQIKNSRLDNLFDFGFIASFKDHYYRKI
jgi:hypothetical protein